MPTSNRIPPMPILPQDKQDPTGVDRLERGAIRQMEIRIRRSVRDYIKVFESIPVEPVMNKKYLFRLDQILLEDLMAQANAAVDDVILEGGMAELWFTVDYVAKAHETGTIREYFNLAAQSPAYKAANPSSLSVLRSEPYLRRLALLRAREFEEISKLSADIKADLGRILADGLGSGKNPLEVARNMRGVIPIEEFRARRIARTEITTALRRARWDEHEEAREEYGLNSMLLFMSALSPTTRPSHAARHGKLYTPDEMREWYSQDANSINCKCSQTSVLVDREGNPLNPRILDRMKEIKENSEYEKDQEA